MRKILSGFLATSMIVAMASATTFAATAPSIEFNVADGEVTTAPVGSGVFAAPTTSSREVVYTPNVWTLDVTYGTFTITLPNAGGATIDIPLNAKIPYTAPVLTPPTDGVGATYNLIPTIDGSDLIDLLDNKTFSTIINGYHYTGKLIGGAGTLKVQFDQTGTLDVTGAIPSVTITNSITLPTYEQRNKATPAIVYQTIVDTVGTPAVIDDVAITLGTVNVGSGTSYTDEETGGSFTTEGLTAKDVILSDRDGNPVVFTENFNAVDEDQNTEGGVQSDKTLYFLIRDDAACVIDKLEDDTYWKLKISKGDNGKYIKSISDVSKNFSTGLYPLGINTKDTRTVGRHRYIKVEMNELFTDDEYKITLDMRLSAKSKAVDAKVKVGNGVATDDSEIKVKDFYFYVKNLVKAADNDWKVGISGLMLNPVTNDWNDVTWFDEDGDVAHMKFFADSDTNKFYSKLSTKWEHPDYASYFNDQDAFMFSFTGSPKLSSTSRADLEIYNPFVDEDGNETIDPATATIYQIIDGDLVDVTPSFSYEEGENGDMAYVTRTRFLGTYIICEKPIEQAVDSVEDPDELLPSDGDTAGEPSDVTTGNDSGNDSDNDSKAPANTGRYL